MDQLYELEEQQFKLSYDYKLVKIKQGHIQLQKQSMEKGIRDYNDLKSHYENMDDLFGYILGVRQQLNDNMNEDCSVILAANPLVTCLVQDCIDAQNAQTEQIFSKIRQLLKNLREKLAKHPLAIEQNALLRNIQKLQVELKNCGSIIAQTKETYDKVAQEHEECVERLTNSLRHLECMIAASTGELQKLIGTTGSQNNSEPLVEIPTENEEPSAALDETMNESIVQMIDDLSLSPMKMDELLPLSQSSVTSFEELITFSNGLANNSLPFVASNPMSGKENGENVKRQSSNPAKSTKKRKSVTFDESVFLKKQCNEGTSNQSVVPEPRSEANVIKAGPAEQNSVPTQFAAVEMQFNNLAQLRRTNECDFDYNLILNDSCENASKQVTADELSGAAYGQSKDGAENCGYREDDLDDSDMGACGYDDSASNSLQQNDDFFGDFLGTFDKYFE